MEPRVLPVPQEGSTFTTVPYRFYRSVTGGISSLRPHSAPGKILGGFCGVGLVPSCMPLCLHACLSKRDLDVHRVCRSSACSEGHLLTSKHLVLQQSSSRDSTLYAAIRLSPLLLLRLLGIPSNG